MPEYDKTLIETRTVKNRTYRIYRASRQGSTYGLTEVYILANEVVGSGEIKSYSVLVRHDDEAAALQEIYRLIGYDEPPKENEPPEEVFVCPVCGEQFTRNIAMLVHQSIHHPGTLPEPPSPTPVSTEREGALTRQVYLAQKYINENWMMLLFGVLYSSLLGVSMYQSYSWET